MKLGMDIFFFINYNRVVPIVFVNVGRNILLSNRRDVLKALGF